MSAAFGGQTKSKSRHSNKVASFSIVQQGEISKTLFHRYLATLQQPPPGRGVVLRFKAILAVSGTPQKVAVHAVQDVVDQELLDDWQDGEPRICKMVHRQRSRRGVLPKSVRQSYTEFVTAEF